MPNILQRIRQRKIAQWAIAYIAGAWALLQVLDLVANRFAWPNFVVRTLIVVLAVGFLAVLVLAWYHGERGEQRVTTIELLMLAGILMIGGAAVAFVGRDRAESSKRANANTPVVADDANASARSIAVLPFSNLSDSKENEYFSDGITDDVLTALAKIGDLTVISRTSV